MEEKFDVVAMIREKDTFAKLLGIEVLEAKDGRSRVRMELTEHTANAVGNAHGGVLFSLADVAFASACNSEGILSVAIEFSIQYLAPHPSAGVLFARGEKSGETRKLGFYRLEVTAEDGTVVAQGQAVAYKVGTRKPE